MNKRKSWKLLAALGLAVTSLLLVFLLLGEASADVAANGVEAKLTALQVTTSTFTISGTVISAEDGSGIGGVDVFPWNRDEGPTTSTVSATTLASGTYSLTLEAGNYDLIFNPPCGSGFASQSHKGITGPPDVTLTVPLTVGYAISGTVYAIGTPSTTKPPTGLACRPPITDTIALTWWKAPTTSDSPRPHAGDSALRPRLSPSPRIRP
jgi:hypothetical protein